MRAQSKMKSLGFSFSLPSRRLSWRSKVCKASAKQNEKPQFFYFSCRAAAYLGEAKCARRAQDKIKSLRFFIVHAEPPPILAKQSVITATDIAEGKPLCRWLVQNGQDKGAGSYSTTSSNWSLPTPQRGQTQSSGMSSKAVPGSMPPSGSPTAGSYTHWHTTQ